MPSEPDEPRPVEGEVVPPPGGERPPEARKSFFEPFSGLVILGVDCLAFGLEWGTGFALTAFASAAAFAVTYAFVSAIQRRAGDSPKRAAAKALLGALAAGVPFPVTGTAVGALILALSGLPDLTRRRQ